MRRFCILFALLIATLASPIGPRVTIKAVGDNGTVAFLSNGETYEVRALNRPKVASWPHDQEIGVYVTSDREFPYRLVLRPGHDDADIVSAIRLTRQSNHIVTPHPSS
jgi:hypothetical protein